MRVGGVGEGEWGEWGCRCQMVHINNLVEITALSFNELSSYGGRWRG